MDDRKPEWSHLQEDFEAVRIVGSLKGFFRAVQRKNARDEWRGIHKTSFEQPQGMGKSATSGAHYGDFFDNEGSRIEVQLSVVRAFQDYGAPRSHNVHGQIPARGISGSLHHDVERNRIFRQIAQRDRRCAHPFGERHFFGMFPNQRHLTAGEAKYHADQHAEFPIPYDEDAMTRFNLHLFQNFQSCGDGFDKYRSFVFNLVRNRDEV